MAEYYVNNNRQEGQGNNNEVHREGCYWLGLITNKTYLGDYNSCEPAVIEAKKIYPDSADGCAVCSSDCNNG